MITLKAAVESARDVAAADAVRGAVEAVIAAVRERGDDAVREYSQKFDDWSPESFVLDQEAIDRIIAGHDVAANLVLLDDLCETLTKGSLCAMGGLTPMPVQSAVKHFPGDFDRPPVDTSGLPVPDKFAAETAERNAKMMAKEAQR